MRRRASLALALAPQPDQLDGLLEPQAGGAVDRVGRGHELGLAGEGPVERVHLARVAAARREIRGEVVAARQEDVGPVGALGAQQVDQERVGGGLARQRPLRAVAVVARGRDHPDQRDGDEQAQDEAQRDDERRQDPPQGAWAARAPHGVTATGGGTAAVSRAGPPPPGAGCPRSSPGARSRPACPRRAAPRRGGVSRGIRIRAESPRSSRRWSNGCGTSPR